MGSGVTVGQFPYVLVVFLEKAIFFYFCKKKLKKPIDNMFYCDKVKIVAGNATTRKVKL